MLQRSPLCACWASVSGQISVIAHLQRGRIFFLALPATPAVLVQEGYCIILSVEPRHQSSPLCQDSKYKSQILCALSVRGTNFPMLLFWCAIFQWCGCNWKHLGTPTARVSSDEAPGLAASLDFSRRPLAVSKWAESSLFCFCSAAGHIIVSVVLLTAELMGGTAIRVSVLGQRWVTVSLQEGPGR